MTVKPSARQPVRLVGSGVECQVYRVLGTGGEGTVFAVGDSRGNQLALKWYHPQMSDQARWETLRTLIRIGPPDDRFLWPLELAVLADAAAVARARQNQPPDSFGYVMPLREARFREMTEHLRRRVEPGIRELATAGLQLADSFLQLHTKGLCYRDISRSNVFFDPGTGDILICDNDNVGIDGQDTSILGTPTFMAPEVVREEALPSTKTDRYSLAVLLFLMFVIHHPLVGQKDLAIPDWEPDRDRRLMGFDPVFIYDPADRSNRPVPGHHDNAIVLWATLPGFFKDLFVRAFTDGLRDPVHGRVTEAEWRGALARLRDLVMLCPGCRQQNFYDPTAAMQACCGCGSPVRPPLRLALNHHEVVLDEGAKLYPHHLVPRVRFDYSTVLAEVVAHPEYDVTGLTNHTAETWTFTTPEGVAGSVTPGATVRIQPGLALSFGAVDGKVVA